MAGILEIIRYLKLVFALIKIWKSFAPFVQEKALHLIALGKFTISHELAPPLPAFPASDVSGRVWPTLTTTQQVGISLKILLGFATYCAASFAPIKSA